MRWLLLSGTIALLPLRALDPLALKATPQPRAEPKKNLVQEVFSGTGPERSPFGAAWR